MDSEATAGGEPAARWGIWWPGRSTLSATCTVAGTVQESLWKLLTFSLVPKISFGLGTLLSAQLKERLCWLIVFTVLSDQDKEVTVNMVKSLNQSGRACCVLSASDPGSSVDL